MGEEVANEYGVSARNAIKVRVATSPEDLDDESIDQEVEFVHQVRWCTRTHSATIMSRVQYFSSV